MLEGHRSKRERSLRQLQGTIAGGITFALAYAIYSLVLAAAHPSVALGISLQALAGLVASGRLWANSASDGLIRWGARQIRANRLGIAGLLDGRPLSLILATAWCAAGFFLGVVVAWPPTNILEWLIAIPAIALLWSGSAVYLVVLTMFVGRALIGAESPPDGAALRTLEAKLASNDGVLLLAGLGFLAGTVLELLAA